MQRGAPVVSVYLDLRWRDPRERGRARLFLESELGRARPGATEALATDLDWVARQLAPLFDDEALPWAHGLALFVSSLRGLREAFALGASIEDSFVVGDRPFVSPLADALIAGPASLAVLVDAPQLVQGLATRVLGMLGASGRRGPDAIVKSRRDHRP